MKKELHSIFYIYESILENKKKLFLEYDIEGIDELVYNPATKKGGTVGFGYDQGVKKIGIEWKGHDNHLHIAFTNKQVAMEVIDKANEMGLYTTENPYAKNDPNQKVDSVHTQGSFHNQMFEGEPKVGKAVDISGNPKKLTELITWIESKYADNPSTFDSRISKKAYDDATKSLKKTPSEVQGDLKTQIKMASSYGSFSESDNEKKLNESFGQDVQQSYESLTIPATSNKKIYSPVQGKVNNRKYFPNCTNQITIEIKDNQGYLQFCNITNPKVRNNSVVENGTLLGTTDNDVDVFLYNKNFKKTKLSKNRFDSDSSTQDTENKKTKKDIETKAEPKYYDPVSAFIPQMVSSFFQDKKDKETGEIEKRWGPGTDPYIVNAISKPFKKIGKFLGTNKDVNENTLEKNLKLKENVLRIKKLLK